MGGKRDGRVARKSRISLKALAEKFNQDNRIFPGFSEGIARPENLRIVVMSLGNVICGLTDKIVNSIFETDASLFIDTSRILGRLEGCSNEVLSTLAAHAVRPSNYGPPRLWSQEDVETVGVVFAGLKPDAITTIPADAMQGLTPLAIKNLPPTGLLSFTTEQLSKMSFSAAMALTPSQLNNLTPAELEAVRAVLQVQPALFNVPVVADDHQSNANQDLVARDIPTGDENTTDIHGRYRDDIQPNHSSSRSGRYRCRRR
ncbi:Stereocilin [Orchesella cincta]|uniref:Stereocilin n=1 Tax=Orchesella cincta TaxID=48709 RepID=A0A1D2NJE6_ORCCI|nr:Stereocilin [Orchesella cincta]